jgi:hypothetical protein
MSMAQLRSDYEPGERYPVLRIIGPICTGTEVFLLVVGSGVLAFGLYSFLAGPTLTPLRGGAPFPPRPVGLAPLMKGLSTMVSLWALGLLGAGLQALAMGSLFRMAIQVEENTRTSARCLEKLCSRLEPRVENTGPFFVS